jgi:hypothetical protein
MHLEAASGGMVAVAETSERHSPKIPGVPREEPSPRAMGHDFVTDDTDSPDTKHGDMRRRDSKIAGCN